ncbi:putative exocyst complex component sec5 protein [Phaeoacremonium minimum UCRPA7]|uniref:Exocyst complex component SEC5 n=1 Tax=Phaeoacremonium minimum (strain UCR-PA7) TaxID=1286976 RepID=R8BDX7_PHAM7|nr:putative exocyst complex component sec5 protein [Phaeoacremonium minimum UCRPA7]EON97504.1 putative exocyst complex component sec5 protein [Phaeoacremonium minimum UCRPA7]
MADLERTVLEYYQVSNPYPVEWPAEKNNSDASDEEDTKSKLNRRKSRYQALERAVSNRSSVIPGQEKSANGVGNIVQKDEPDPLGTTDSVVRTLKQLGLPLQDDPKLRNRFLLSSTTFSPALFLSQMHSTADTRSLLQGLDVLSQSIDQKSASLKVLVESNFERFVRAKATIDNVYKEMKYRGADPTPTRQRGHSRHASRNSFRSSSGGMGMTSPLAPAADPRKKNALIKESEYGVMGIKVPLLDVLAKAEDVWGPALGGREKEENLRVVASSLERYKEYVETSAAISDSIKRKDHESLVEEYTKARRWADEARGIAQELGSAQPTDAQLYQIVLAARMWHDVDEQIQAFKRDIWRKLISLHNVSNSDTPGQPQDQHMELISLLLELGVEDNPIWVWLLSRYDYLKGKIQSTADRSKIEIEVLRRRLANGSSPGPQLIASHLKFLGRQSMESKLASFDTPDIVELWEKMVSFLSSLLSSKGIIGEVVEFWQTVQGFLDGKTQRTLPMGYNGESKNHHRLSQQGVVDLQKGTVELVDMYVTTLYKSLSGMVENAERSIKKADDDWTTEVDGYVIVNGASDRAPSMGGGTVNAGDRNVRMLLTLSNLQSLRAEVVPGLNTQFENAFSVKLTDETKTIRDVLGQIDARLFQSYTRPSIEALRKIVRDGVTAADWAPATPTEKPREVKPYVYEALLTLVLVHTQVSTTANSLTSQVLSYLLEQTSRELLEAFKTRPKYNLSALMQATLDVEFVAQTLSQYMTERASELQSQIYQELDGRTDNEARAKLQNELPEMRSVLKRLRESSKNEFACFRKPKRAQGDSRRETTS